MPPYIFQPKAWLMSATVAIVWNKEIYIHISLSIFHQSHHEDCKITVVPIKNRNLYLWFIECMDMERYVRKVSRLFCSLFRYIHFKNNEREREDPFSVNGPLIYCRVAFKKPVLKLHVQNSGLFWTTVVTTIKDKPMGLTFNCINKGYISYLP